MEIKEEMRELVPRLEDEVIDWEYEDGGSLPLLFNYTNIYMLPLTNIFFTTCLIMPFHRIFSKLVYTYMKYSNIHEISDVLTTPRNQIHLR